MLMWVMLGEVLKLLRKNVTLRLEEKSQESIVEEGVAEEGEIVVVLE